MSQIIGVLARQTPDHRFMMICQDCPADSARVWGPHLDETDVEEMWDHMGDHATFTDAMPDALNYGRRVNTTNDVWGFLTPKYGNVTPCEVPPFPEVEHVNLK
jgi:hypothetical protein